MDPRVNGVPWSALLADGGIRKVKGCCSGLARVTIVCFKKISNQVLVLKSMKIRENWTMKYIKGLVRARQIVL